MKMIEIKSGDQREAGYADYILGKFWTVDELKLNGLPDLRVKGRSFKPKWIRGFKAGSYAEYSPEREVQAGPIRDEIRRLQSLLSQAEDALFSVYAGPKPQEVVS